MANPDHMSATSHAGFRTLRTKLNNIVANVEKVPAHPEAEGQTMSAWGVDALDALSEVLTDTKRAICSLPEPAQTSWSTAVNNVVRSI